MMKLHEALKKVFWQFGIAVLQEKRLIFILADFKAFDEYPAMRKVMEAVVSDIERNLNNRMEKEISSELIGEIVMEHLKDLDEVAYVRFASVYRQFKDVSTFVAEVEKLLGDNRTGGVKQ